MENKSKEKIYLDKRIHLLTKDQPITWGDIKHFQFEDNDHIECGYVEGYYSENNSWNPHYTCVIIRKVWETDEQFEKRQRQIELEKKWAKERRYETYLKLKQEFDTPTLTRHD